MITIEFAKGAAADERSWGLDPATVHPVILRSTYCRTPVQITVNGAVLFRYGPQASRFRGLKLPLLDAAIWGRKQLAEARGTGLGRYDIPAWWPAVYFRVVNQRASISYTGRSSHEDTLYVDLLQAWDEFSSQVRRYLRSTVPQLAANRFWGAWLQDASATIPPLPAPLIRQGDTSLQFGRDAEELARARHDVASWVGAPVAAMENALELPVELVVGGTEILPGSLQGAIIIPCTAVLSLAAGGLQALRWARRFGRGQYFLPSIPETPMVLWFELIGEDVFVWFNITGAVAQVPYAELLAVWERFVLEVREYVSREAPELLTQPYVGAWLAGTDYEDIPALHPWDA